MTYRVRPWKGRKPGWASAAEIRAEGVWLRLQTNKEPHPAYTEPGSALWEPGGVEMMNATGDDLDALARLQDEYIMDAYVRGVRAGTVEEMPDWPVPPLLRNE